MSKGYLLDVNVLLAIGFSQHRFNTVAKAYLGDDTHWATCSITQLGFVRIGSNNAIFQQNINPQQAWEILNGLCQDPYHQYLAENPNLLNCDFSKLTGHKQVTDAYLVALARQHQFTLLTMDKRLVNSFPNECIQLLA